MSAGNFVQQLLQMIANRNANQPMSEKIPGVGGTPVTLGTPQAAGVPVSPAKPDINTSMGPILTPGSAVPGANIPMSQKQYPQTGQPSAYREYSTSGGHKRAAMADIFGNAREILTTSQKNRDAKEARALAVDIERFMTAAANLTNLDGTPNTQNQQIIADMMSDKKKAKEIQEALNVSFFGEDKRDPVKKQAADMALKKLQELVGKPDFSQQLNKIAQLPSVPQINPQLQAQAQLVKDKVLPTADQILKSNTDLNKAMQNDASKERIAAIVASTKDAELRSKVLDRLSADNRAILLGTIRMKIAQLQADTTLKKTQMIESRLKSVQAKGDKELEDMIKQANSLTAQIKSTADQVKNTPEEGWIFKDSTEKDKAKKRLEDLQKQFDDLQKLINNKRITGALSNVSNTGNTAVNQSTDDNFDPDKFLQGISDYESIVGANE